MRLLFPWLQSFDRALAWLEKQVLVLTTILLVVLVFGQVVARPFGLSFPWADELSRFLMLVLAFLGASLATRRRRHITIDIITKGVSPQMRAWFALAWGLSAGVFCVYLAFVGWQYVGINREFNDLSSALKFPYWIVQAVIPLALGVISFRFFLGAWECLSGLRHGDLTFLNPHEEVPR